jgi:hypothetical protein
VELGKPNNMLVKQSHKLAILQGEEGDLDVRQEVELQRELKILMEQEDLKWRQCAKMDWLKFGD